MLYLGMVFGTPCDPNQITSELLIMSLTLTPSMALGHFTVVFLHTERKQIYSSALQDLLPGLTNI